MTSYEVFMRYTRLTNAAKFPALPAGRFALHYESERMEWLRAKAKETDTEYVRRTTSPFRRIWTKANPDPLITGASLPDGLSAVRAVLADFALKGGRLSGRPVTPITDDRLGVVSADPTTTPDDWFPVYTEEGNHTLLIHSTTPPLSVTIRYFLRPKSLEAIAANNIEPLLEDTDAIDEILRRVMAAQSLIYSQPQYNPIVSQQIPVHEQNP